MQDAKLKSYLDAWTQVSRSTPETIAAMIAGAHPDILFTDVNSANVHTGHEGIRTISRLASERQTGGVVAYEALLFDGRNWSIRWTLSRQLEDGSEFTRRGASAGSVAEDGRVIEHTDYWSKAGFLH
jgi:hypothetical protein